MLNRRASFVAAGTAGAATLTAASAPSPLYPVYQRLWGFSDFTLTLIFAVYVFALLVALLTVGSLSDQVGRRPVASTSLVLLAVGMLLFALAGGTGGLIAARVVQGFAVGAAAGTITAMIMDTAPNPRSGSLVSSGVPSLGIAVGAVLAGALVQFAPAPRQLVFWILGATFLVLATLVWWIPDQYADHVQSGSRSRRVILRSLLPSAGLPARTRPTFVALLPSIGATWALAGLYLSLGSSVLASVLHVHSLVVTGIVLGAFFAAGTTGTAVSTVLPGRLRGRLGHVTLALGVLITIAATLAALLPLYVLGSVLAGLGFGASFHVVVDTLDEVASSARRGEVFATMYIASYLAFSVPALAAGLAVGRFGLEPTVVTYGVVEVVLVLVALVAQHATDRRETR